jgi:hypothetical protein
MVSIKVWDGEEGAWGVVLLRCDAVVHQCCFCGMSREVNVTSVSIDALAMPHKSRDLPLLAGAGHSRSCCNGLR